MSNDTISQVTESESKIGDKGEIITVSVSTKESHRATVEGKLNAETSNGSLNEDRVSSHLGPESHSVHTLKSTKIVVEENGSSSPSKGISESIEKDDAEVEDLMKRIQKQRSVLDEILTEQKDQVEGTS